MIGQIAAVERYLTYRYLVQKPTVSRTLNKFGDYLNRKGIPYATGLTRNAATLFVSKDQAEKEQARIFLTTCNRARANWIIDEAMGRPSSATFSKPYRVFDTSIREQDSLRYWMNICNPISQFVLRPLVRLAGPTHPLLGGLYAGIGFYLSHIAIFHILHLSSFSLVPQALLVLGSCLNMRLGVARFVRNKK
jgi:hypothetical protein